MSFFRKYNRKQVKPSAEQEKQAENRVLKKQLTDNIKEIHKIFTEAPDLVVREFIIKQTSNKAALIFLSGASDPVKINDSVLYPLLFEENVEKEKQDPAVSLGHIAAVNTYKKVEEAILQGNSVLLVDNAAEAFVFATEGWPSRSLESPKTDPSLRGAHVGFSESGNQNIALVRKYIQNSELKINNYIVGKRGHSNVYVLYLKDVTDPQLLQILEERIQKIDVDAVINSGSLSEYIEDNSFSPFPQLLVTERPDTAASELLNGRIVIILDKSPDVLIAPVTFSSFFKSIDDFGIRWLAASFTRIIRYLGFYIAIFLPAIYIAVITFHSEILPLKLLFSIGVSRERVPFQPLIEAFIMEITLEMLREAAVRLPTPISQTVGVVGGIVIGQAAVEAGIVSNVMVIVVALTAISSFIIPNYDMGSAIRLIRFPMMILASLFGFLGVIVGFMLMLTHFITLKSLGTPYSIPLSPLRLSDLKDVIFRLPQWSLIKRPTSTNPLQQKKSGQMPSKDDNS